MKFVNVYRLERAYGGPEEGGWYYDDLTPIKSVRASRKRLRKKVMKRLKAEFPNPNSAGRILGGNPNDLDSVADFDENDCTGLSFGHDIVVYVENRPAHYWPRPYYC